MKTSVDTLVPILFPCVMNIPVNYNRYLQSLIYRVIDDDSGYSGFLHDKGFDGYRFFTFGRLRGEHKILGKNLSFQGKINWEIRSASDEFCDRLKKGPENCRELNLAGDRLRLCEAETTRAALHLSKGIVRTLMPIVVCANRYDGHIIYYPPSDERFVPGPEENFIRKYTSFYGSALDGKVRIEVLSIGKKQVTKYRDKIRITGWHCRLELKGASHVFVRYGVGQKERPGIRNV